MEVNNNKTKVVRHLGVIDTSNLKRRVEKLSEEEWDTKEDYDANYNKTREALSSAKHIIFKFSNKQVKPFEYFECSRWKDWKDVLLPVMDQATSQYNYKRGFYSRVMLAKLTAKSFIRMHTDGDESGTKPHKIHVPLQTNESVFFFVEEERFHFEENFAYEVNNSARHAAANNGETDRIHLIFEYLNIDDQLPEIKDQITSSNR